MRVEFRRAMVLRGPGGESLVVPPTRPEAFKKGEHVGFRPTELNVPDSFRRSKEFQHAEAAGAIREVKGPKGKKVEIPQSESKRETVLDAASGAKIVKARGAKNAGHRKTRAALPTSGQGA